MVFCSMIRPPSSDPTSGIAGVCDNRDMTDELTPREVADELEVTVRTVQRWIASGRLPATRVGSRVRVSRSSLASVADDVATVGGAVRTLLVVNRGEIAVRIARTAHSMGMRVVGIHADDERPPDGMDATFKVGSYLDGEELLEVARRSGADAIHPGYGFLAENPEFARGVTTAGLAWVGPPADAIAAMGDKAAARTRAAAEGVPTVPGYDRQAQDDATLVAEAERIGYPLLVKPSAGGGGKGMRVVRSADGLPDALAGARREAHRSFGDDRLILERYLAGARHVEVQVLFDAHGAGIHLGERDCSAQRRNQKIVEEAPAPSVRPEVRARLGDAAVRVAAAVGYVSAGTVEMLLTDAGEFFFLEMNTRLQVEHPVTEAVTGRDLVQDQLRIAGGATLASLGLNVPPAIRGHAIEARIYAEDPDSGFLPATGRLEVVSWPDDVRVDTGIREGDDVTGSYDPMLAKVIAHGPTRDAALAQLRTALAGTAILGVRTNVRFLRWLLELPVTRDGEMRTDTIGGLDLPPPPIPEERHWWAASLVVEPSQDDRPWGGGWRLNAPSIVRLRHGDGERAVRQGSGTRVSDPMTWDGPRSIRGEDAIYVDVEGQSLEFTPAPPPTVDEAVRHAGGADEGTAILTAPMPGRVIALRAAEGTSVEAHQAVVIIEAMKMEHAVTAPTAGTLTRVTVAEGDQVGRGDVLAEVAPYHEADG
jgi:acetyl-CoA/propionyl-CoA carboxylase, biotin carboxylase, biotin carboxyl carrier protein